MEKLRAVEKKGNELYKRRRRTSGRKWRGVETTDRSWLGDENVWGKEKLGPAQGKVIVTGLWRTRTATEKSAKKENIGSEMRYEILKADRRYRKQNGPDTSHAIRLEHGALDTEKWRIGRGGCEKRKKTPCVTLMKTFYFNHCILCQESLQSQQNNVNHQQETIR